MKCKNVQNNLPAYLETALSEEERASIKSHLANCSTCQAELKYLEKEAKILASMPKVTVPASFATEVLERAEKEVYSKGFFQKLFNWNPLFPKIQFAMAAILGAIVVTGVYQYGIKEKDMIKNGSSSIGSYFTTIPSKINNWVTEIFSDKKTYDVAMPIAMILKKTNGKIMEYEASIEQTTLMIKIPKQNYDIFVQNIKSEYPLSNIEIISKNRKKILLSIIIKNISWNA